jgi:hypothetical protein
MKKPSVACSCGHVRAVFGDVSSGSNDAGSGSGTSSAGACETID